MQSIKVRTEKVTDHVCVCRFRLHYPESALQSFQKNLLILEWGLGHFYNCLDNQEEKSSRIKTGYKPQCFVIYCYFYLMFQQATLLAALENAMKRHSKPQNSSACKKMVLQAYLRLLVQDTDHIFSWCEHGLFHSFVSKRGRVWAQQSYTGSH